MIKGKAMPSPSKGNSRKTVGREAEPVIFVTATTVFQAAPFHPLPSPWNFPRVSNLRNSAFCFFGP